jgi:hypothetical protein
MRFLRRSHAFISLESPRIDNSFSRNTVQLAQLKSLPPARMKLDPTLILTGGCDAWNQ